MSLNFLIHIIIFVIAVAIAIFFIVLWRYEGKVWSEEERVFVFLVLLVCWGVVIYFIAGASAIVLNLPEWEGIFLLIGIFGSFFVFYIYAKIYVHLRKKTGQIKFRPKKPRKEECPKCGSLLISRRHVSGLSTSPSMIKKTCRKCGYKWTERKKDKLGKEEELTELKLQLGRGDITFAEYEQKKKKLLEKSET